MVHTYKSDQEAGRYTVGIFHPKPTPTQPVMFLFDWHPMRTFDNEEQAAAYVNYLNGGDGRVWAGE
jgi:hypothetical protein